VSTPGSWLDQSIQAFIGQIERHYFRIACEGKQIVKLEPGYAYGQSISLSFRTFYLCFL